MAKTIEEMLAKRPVDRVAVNTHKKHLIDEVRAAVRRRTVAGVALRSFRSSSRSGDWQSPPIELA